ncbi:UBX domain-containing protein 8 isoform X5 [Enhydra lutris kenyoni]|uniref:UBX domain-containing protein 8 isoform X5 n=1 Tax=Enhydra lutris kenyoni TaxID=391180 RepID=A0A2Y9J0W6_ENHLU|nr:UBX domain-containing protein 8 isoform X5 [Enhydra lutris kenyoni]
MASRGVIGVFLLSALPLLCLELRRGIPDLGIKDLILLCGRIFLLLALLTLIISVTTSWLNSFKSSQVYLKEEEEKNEEKQKLVRKKQQEAQGEKGDEDLVLENEAFKTSNREAAKRRNLPKLLTKISPSAEQPTRNEVLDLPEEPPETGEEVVTVALRCPSGSVLRRRFFKSCSSQVLFDWMMKIGYHTSQYSLSTSFPRCPLEVGGGWSLQDIGITVDTVLNVEENEQTTNEERRTTCSP